MKIWAKNTHTGIVENIDECSKSSASYLVREYQLAYGRQWIVWAGLKRDEPRSNQ